MKSKLRISLIPHIYGFIVTFLMLVVFGTTLILALIENWPGELKEISAALLKWYDDPTGFFFTYIAGYTIVWWKQLFGSLIIMLGSLLVVIINIDNKGFLIFAVPAFLVGFFYIENWYRKFKNRKTPLA